MRHRFQPRSSGPELRLTLQAKQEQTLQVSPALTRRQELEAELMGALTQVPRLAPTLEWYKKRERTATKLYEKAAAKGRIARYDRHGIKFEYARVQSGDVPADILKECGSAFSHCLYDGFLAFFNGRKRAMAQGSWLLFVVVDLFHRAPRYVEYAAVHERGEQVTLGEHHLATKLEFAVAKKEGKLMRYLRWLERHEPRKFADVISYEKHLDIPDSEEFRALIEESAQKDEAARVRQLIEKFEWPEQVLRRMVEYKRKNDEVMEIASAALQAAHWRVRDFTEPIPELVAVVRREMTEALRPIRHRHLEPYISAPRLNFHWEQGRIELDKEFMASLERPGRRQDMARYIAELKEAEIKDGLPRDGVLSLSFNEAMEAL